MWSVSADPLKFEEAVRWFEAKVPLLPGEFRRLEAEAKRWAFTMAGVAELDRLAWLHQTLLDALEKGQTLDEWRKRVRERLKRAHPGHLETVFRTNVQSAYAAGRWKQLNHPAVKKARPYWMFDAILDARTTPICRTRDGTVLPADHPWWQNNTPPLHFNCRSGIRALTEAEARARGIATAPPEDEPPQEGFGLPPDAEDWADTYARGVRARIGDPGGWELAFVGEPPDWRSYGRPERLPERKAPRKPLPTVEQVGKGRFLALLAGVLGGLSVELKDPTGLPVVVDRRLVDHLKPDGRERFLAWLDDLVQDPEELWLVPMRRAGGRRVVFRQRYLKVYRYGRKRHVVLVLEFHRGVLVGVTFIESRSPSYLQNMRKGFLRYARPQ